MWGKMFENLYFCPKTHELKIITFDGYPWVIGTKGWVEKSFKDSDFKKYERCDKEEPATFFAEETTPRESFVPFGILI